MGRYNPSSPATLGLEWLTPDAPSSYVLGSAAAAYGIAMPLGFSSQFDSFKWWAQAVSGSGVYGTEFYGSPLIATPPQTTDVDLPGTDTGADYTSPQNSNAAWLTETAAAATFTKIQNAADDVNYLRNVNGFENPNNGARMLVRGANALQLAGVRVLSVEVRARVKSTMTGNPQLLGALRLSGTTYNGSNASVPTNTGYNDVSLGTWNYNPRTLRPWVLAEVNNLIFAGATDSFGFSGWWLFQAADTLRVSQMYLRVRWCPEDRIGYGSSVVTVPGWQNPTAKSVPNLHTAAQAWSAVAATPSGWVAGANTTTSNQADRPAAWSASVSALQLLSTAAGGVSAHLATRVPCIPGKAYSWGAGLKTPIVVTVALSFFDASGNALGPGTGISFASIQPLQNANSLWSDTLLSTPVIAPDGAATMDVTISATATAGAQAVRVAGMLLSTDFVPWNIYFTLPAAAPSNGATEQTGILKNNLASPYTMMAVMRRLAGTGAVSIPTMTPGASSVGQPQGHFSYRPTLADQSGAIYVLGPTFPDTAPIQFILTGAAGIDEDSQVYAARTAAKVNTGNTVKQEITTPVATLGFVRLVVAGEVDPPAAALLVKLKRTSDNVQIGGTATILPTDLAQVIPAGGSAASRTTPQVLSVYLASNAVTTAVQHYLEFTSTAAAGSGWVVYLLDDKGQGDAATYYSPALGFNAGATDAATDPANGGRQTGRDVMATIATVPATPGGIAGSAQAGFNRTTWTVTTLGATFAATEVWRSEDAGATFQQVADLALEAAVKFDDYESKRGTAATYKIRSRRKDGALSAFTGTVGPFTQTLVAGRYRFVTNEVAAGGPPVEGNDYSKASTFTDRPYEFVLTSTELEFEGRDGAVVFLPTETEGDRFTVPFALYAEGGEDGSLAAPAGTLKGRAAFEALRLLTRQAVSYVCVLDSEGGRWYSTCTLANATREEPGQLYTVDVAVRQTATVSSTPIASP